MKLYILDDDGRVLFDFSDVSGGCALSAVTSTEDKVKSASLTRAALKFLMEQLKVPRK